MAQYIADTFPAVIEQDRWALEKQQEMVDFPDEGYAEVHLKSDQAIMRLRKILSEMESQDHRSAA
jgi:vanillate O-demethylase monooxygenase subunit